jgi:hypothetical protein
LDFSIKKSIELRAIKTPPPWQGFVAPVSDFPTPDEELKFLKPFLKQFNGVLETQWKLSSEVFFQFSQLHLGDGASQISSHARDWLPELGLGVWPDRPAPTPWSKEEFMNVGLGDTLRTVSHKLLRVSAPPPSREHAREAMLGFGAVLQIMTSEPTDNVLAKAKALLLPRIEHPSFRNFEFYIPLIEARSIENATPDKLQSWACGASVYVRESSEDKGVLIISREPLGPIFEALHGRPNNGAALSWCIPV